MTTTVVFAALLDDEEVAAFSVEQPHAVKQLPSGGAKCAGGPMWLAASPDRTFIYACTLNSSELVRFVFSFVDADQDSVLLLCNLSCVPCFLWEDL